MPFNRVKRLPPRPADFRCKSAPQYPYNDFPTTPQSSEPRYGVKLERNVYVPTSDGFRVAADIYRPDVEDRYPAILAMSPYTKELQGTDSASLCNEVGDIEFFVTRGYVYIVADSRGSGHTGGDVGFLSEREILDGVDLVEWIAAQSWCNGNVGMSGMSWFALVQCLVAQKRPAHLKCIFAHDPGYDIYRDLSYHGGKMSLFMWLMPIFILADYVVFLLAKGDRGEPIKWTSFLAQGLAFILQRHKFDDAWMRERSGFWQDEISDVPTYVGSGWEYAVGLHLRGVFDVYRDAAGPKRMLVGPPQVPFRPFSSWRTESLRWYDSWLKGMDTGIEKDAPINIWIMGQNRWRGEYEWPIARTEYRTLFLRPDGVRRQIGQLLLEPAKNDEHPLSYISWPFSASHLGLPQLVYRSPILRSDLEVTGHIVLRLFASCSAKDTSFMVKLCDEAEDGSFRVLTKGWLKASHRESDEERSLPYRPFHPHLREQKLERGRIYEFLIEVWPTANLFLAGHRIRLEVACAESLYYDFPYVHFPSPNVGKVRIFSSPEYPSSLILPILDSDLVLENEGVNIQFHDRPTSYFATRGQNRVFGENKLRIH